MEINLVEEGIKFMILGMSIVFIFLVVMMFSIKIMSFIVNRYFPEKKPEVATSKTLDLDNKKVVAAITAAIAYHKNKKRD